MHADHPRRVYACVDPLSSIFDNYDLAARDLTDGGIFGGDSNAIQPVEFGSPMSLSSAVATGSVVVKSDAHGGEVGKVGKTSEGDDRGCDGMVG